MTEGAGSGTLDSCTPTVIMLSSETLNGITCHPGGTVIVHPRVSR
jgi:hypothetical protein